MEEGLRWRVFALHGQSEDQVVHKLVFTDLPDVEAVLSDALVNVLVFYYRVCSILVGILASELISDIRFALHCENRDEHFRREVL